MKKLSKKTLQKLCKPTYEELEAEIKRLRDQVATMKELAKRIVAWEGRIPNTASTTTKGR